MLKFSEIEQFRNAVRNVTWRAQNTKGADGEWVTDRNAPLPTLHYEGTVKIHGCCSSVRVEGDKITPQSRNNELTVEQDNYNFAKFIYALPNEVWTKLKGLFGDKFVLHGEWAGKGIQDTVAVSQVERFWTIFRIQTIEEDEEQRITIPFYAKAKSLDALNEHRIFNVYQFGVEVVEINFERPAEAVNRINELSLKVEAECPAGKFFGVIGVGEGRVWECITPGWVSSKFNFKVKGEKHSKSHVKKLANVDIEKMKSIEDFVDKHVNEERLTQAWNWLAEQHKEQTEKSTGDFIRWCFNDIIKEESDELKGSGLTEKELGGAVAKKARVWFLTKVNSKL